VKDSKVLEDVKPGQPIRFPVEAKGRFEPVDVNRWINENTISRRHLPTVDDMGATEALREEALKEKGPQKEGALNPETGPEDLQQRTLTQYARAQSAGTPATSASLDLLAASDMPIPHSLFCPIHQMLEPALLAHTIVK
jgi:hypothetical protein